MQANGQSCVRRQAVSHVSRLPARNRVSTSRVGGNVFSQVDSGTKNAQKIILSVRDVPYLGASVNGQQWKT